MLFFVIIRFRASANISLNLFLNIYLFWLLHLSQKNSILFIFLIFFYSQLPHVLNSYCFSWYYPKSKNKRRIFADSNPPKCIANFLTISIHFKWDLMSYQTQKVIKEIVYLKDYILLCYAIFEINIAKNNWLPHLNQTLSFNGSFVLISALCIYRIRYYLVL